MFTWNIKGLKAKLIDFDIFNYLTNFKIFGVKEFWDTDGEHCKQYI